MIIYDEDFSNCSLKQREKFLDKLLSLFYDVSETWSDEDEISMEDELHYLISELLYNYFCFINAGADDDVKKVDYFQFKHSFTLFCNAFLDDKFKFYVDPDLH